MVRKIPDGDKRRLWLESWANLWRYNLLQPEQARSGKGASVRRKGWHSLAGGKSGSANPLYVGGGAVLGFLAGLILGMALPDTGGPPMPLIAALLLAPLGGYGGIVMARGSSFHDGMMLVVANERRSRIRKEMGTAHARVWIPKDLLAFRQHEWRYVSGRPYMWLMLPYGVRYQDALNGTLSYLTLENDFYRAQDAAVYAQRVWNRMIAQNGDDYAVLDEPVQESKPILEYAPWIGAGVIVIAGFLMFVMSK